MPTAHVILSNHTAFRRFVNGIPDIHNSRISAIMKRFMSFPHPLKSAHRLFGGLSPHAAFFILFLFSLPFSIRKVFGVFSPDGTFNEYLDVSLYLSDLLLFATLSTFILCNKKYILSIAYWRRMFHVEHLLLPIFIPGLFILWSGLSIFWSASIPLALATFLHLTLGYGLYLYILISGVPRGTPGKESFECSTWNNPDNKMFHVEHSNADIQNVPRGTFDVICSYIHTCSTWNIFQVISTAIIVSAVFQSIIAIVQFISQKSLGLSFLKESIFSIYDPGVAKIVINGDVFIRAYGLFPHPNVLGGFLAVSVLITMVYPLVFKNTLFHVEHNLIKWLYRASIFIQLLALFLSLSKSAILAFVIGTMILMFGGRKMFHVEHFNTGTQNVPRGTLMSTIRGCYNNCSTWNNFTLITCGLVKKLFHVEQLLIILGSIMIGFVLFSFNLKLFIAQPIMERFFYMKSLTRLSAGYYFEGLGIGQFVFNMQQFFDSDLLYWQLQPIHNVFLLIFSEVGTIGLGLFIWFFAYAFLRNKTNVPRGTLEAELTECSTWNISGAQSTKVFHVEQSNNTGVNEHAKHAKDMTGVYLFRSLLMMMIIIMFFDHYYWDIQQGQLLLWIIVALA
ncbi:MAG: hypothetical protein WAW00_01985, partial [Candidatus Moraniibacteriota bacterium]